jgi:uncharacterized membrane protein YphA (DoxX/SURF4 family)
MRVTKTVGRCLLASVFLVAGAVKLQEFAGMLAAQKNAAPSSAHHAALALPPTLTYVSKRLDLFLSSALGASPSLMASLRPHHAILVALLGLAEVVSALALALAAAPWAAPALLLLLGIVTPVCHCFWLLPAPAAGLELGHALKNTAIAGALLMEMAAGSGGSGRLVVAGRRGGGGGAAAAAARKEE